MGLFQGADLTGATFENCHISAQFEEGIKAPNTVFEGCALSLDWPKADIRNARFIDIESSPDLDFHGGTADGIQLAFAVASESSVKLNLKHASIKGASIQISLNADRRHALEANPNPKLKWMKGMFDEAVVDDATSIQLEPLPGVPEKKSQRKTKGKTKKSQYQDFDRAMDQDEGEISVGESSGVLAGVGDCGWSYVYRFQDIIAIPELYQSGHVASLGESFVHELGQRVAGALVRVPNATYLGSLEIRSNLMQLLVPYVDGSVVEEGDDARIEIPCESGVWAVWTAPIYLEDQSREDELGRYGNIVFLRRE